ncbi:MAG: D-alanyl-D-alanine carboxypeptidase [Alphaproteobacteria bacterium]|nr:D-alanyl-D-alanine carboxypeptidase [Alphaproteobacteria bacterium]MCK5518204.1 D-alanyl-D-alanine carboxypeptidase [Alphaproteobacteria bacterium]MCK5556161.1 D-alanyl-D-alanine carboxypeptidase [Alphaproteobacteria bacterium]MCK5658787.1 D-alanyl-D-alanine carboxypeptidase [Alphaproteobacteria bacterium]
MKKKILLFVAVFLLVYATHSHAAIISTPATHAILLDAGTGTVLLDKNSDERMPTSSMSKVMTLYVVFDALKKGYLKLNDNLLISEKAWRMGGSKMFIREGSKVKVEDLIRGVAIQSGNDATVALAEGIAGSEEAFAERMNSRARELGMMNSHFMNASGWPVPDHYSTPRDLSLLAFRMMVDFPEYYHYFSEKEFTYNKIRQSNRDPLLGKVEGADGIKTGHTEIAGYGLIGSAFRDGRRLILVVNGLQSKKQRAEEGRKLLEWGFRDFESKKILKKGDSVAETEVWLGQEDNVPLVAEMDVTTILPIIGRENVKMTAIYKTPLIAPVVKGVFAGKLRIEIPDQLPVEVNLLTGNSVERKGIPGRVMARFFHLLEERRR